MKPLLLALLMAAFQLAGHAQGQFVFNNRIGTEVNARFCLPSDPPGTSSIGSPDWSVLLLGGPSGTSVGQLHPLDPSFTTFRGAPGTPGAGYVVGITPVVPGVAAGGSASVLVRVVGPGGLSVDYGPYTVSGLGGGTMLPPNLQLGTSIFCIPEPSPFVFGGVAMTALLVRRRTSMTAALKA